MEMDQDLITDITLDHLPELSETSISFQIPSSNASADLLLADNTDGFDQLCSAGDDDDDVSFAPVTLRHPRGRPLTLGELTPRVQVTPHHSQSPTQLPSSSAKPSVIQRSLTLGHGGLDKRKRTPSPVKLIPRQLQSPLVSSERLLQLKANVATLGQVDETPPHVRLHVMESREDDSAECSTSSPNSKVEGNALHASPASEDVPEEKETPPDVEPPAIQDVVMATGDSYPPDAETLAVPTPRPKSKRFPRTSTKSTIAAGGISKRTVSTAHVSKKTKGKPPRVREAHLVLPSAVRQPVPPQSIDTAEDLVPPACMRGDVDSKPENTHITQNSTGGLAERLVSYSQKLISSIGLYKPWPESSLIEVSDDAVRVADAPVEARSLTAVTHSPLPPQCISDISSIHSEPLRLSEISPHKLLPGSPTPTGALQDGRLQVVSPMRPAKKRVSMDADQPQDHHRRKRGRIVVADADSKCGSSNEALSQGQRQPHTAKKTQVHEDQSITHPETHDSSQQSDPSKSTLPSARTKYRPKLTTSQCKGPTLDAYPFLSGSRQVHERINKGRSKRYEAQSKTASVRSESSLSGFSASSCLRQDKRTRQENPTEFSHACRHSGPTPTVDLPLIEKKPNATLPVAQLTKPVGFTFRVDARLEARKGEERLAASEPGKMHAPHPVPDLKSHRASHHAAFIIHKQVPSVPVVPFFFCTEQRAKEREKFDEMVKRKEEEMQRLKEEQQRREVEEEERAIKELRRKAIPKANEIPEWYADMPKRKGTVV